MSTNRRRSRAATLGRYATTVAGGVGLVAGLVGAAAAPSEPSTPGFLAVHARSVLGIREATQALADLEQANAEARADAYAMAELRASRSVLRLPVPAAPPAPAAPAPPPAAAAPPAAPAPAAPARARAAAPKAAKAPKAAATPKRAAPRPAPAPAAPAPRPAVSTARTGAAVERGLTTNSIKVLNAVRGTFPSLSNIGGARSGSADHSSGRALDIMIPNHGSAGGRAAGDALAALIQSRAGELGVEYIIWRQRIWMPGHGGWRPMADRGDATANHYDHVHVSVH